jgi:hypothetical protein
VLVCGGRDYNHAYRVHHALQQLPSDAVIVAGGARGADTLAENSALALGMQVEVHYANWELFGKSAGVRRNQEMLDSGIDYVIAFEGGRGTEDMRKRAHKAGITVYQPDIMTLERSDFDE